MAEEKRKKGRRAHLSSFAPTAAGEYYYTGAHYRWVSGGGSWRRAMAVRWLLAGGAILCQILAGIIPAPGMKNCFYVILPWAGALLAAVSLAWAAARMSYWGNPLRAYVYEKTAQILPARCCATMVFSALTALLTGLYLFLDGSEQVGPLCTCLFFFFQIGCFSLALTLRGWERRQEWQKEGR